jgi:hypothetical protein
MANRQPRFKTGLFNRIINVKRVAIRSAREIRNFLFSLFQRTQTEAVKVHVSPENQLSCLIFV